MHTKLAYGLAVAAAMGLSEAATLQATTLQKRDGSHGHSHAAAPSSGYDTPSAGYSAPATGYGAPDTGYGAPDTGYGAPDTGYGAPSYGGDGGKLPDIFGPLLWPVLTIVLLVGLSLLFPTIVTVDNTGRKKRSLGKFAVILQMQCVYNYLRKAVFTLPDGCFMQHTFQ